MVRRAAQAFGRDKGIQYMRNLAKQDLRMVRGRTAQSQLLAAGERALAMCVGPYGIGIKSERRAAGSGDSRSLLRPGQRTHAGTPSASSACGGVVLRLGTL